jgi:hypothetical protein
LTTKIVDRLKEGRIKNVVPYGEDQLPKPPYIVVRPERDPLNRGRKFRIIVHMKPGQNIFLEDFVYKDLSDLLDNFGAYDRHGNYNILLTENDYTDIIIANDDKTISMERVFLLPSRIF